MTTIPKTSRPDERGFVLILVLVTLLLLTVLGIWASRSAQIELRTATNERIQRDAFYQADAGTHLAERLIYHTKMCASVRADSCLNQNLLSAGLQVPDLCFTENPKTLPDEPVLSPKAGEHDLIYYPNLPENYQTGQDENGATVYTDSRGNVLPHTIVRIGFAKVPPEGEGMSFAERYSGETEGGKRTTYTILSQHRSHFTEKEPGSEAQVNILWKLSGIDFGKGEEFRCQY